MTTIQEGPNKTFIVSAALPSNVLVVLTTGKLALADADDLNVLGYTTRETFAADEAVAVRLLSAEGTHKLTALDAIAAGAVCYAAADGKVAAAGTVVRGTAVTASGADGDYIEVMVG